MGWSYAYDFTINHSRACFFRLGLELRIVVQYECIYHPIHYVFFLKFVGATRVFSQCLLNHSKYLVKKGGGLKLALTLLFSNGLRISSQTMCNM